MEQTRKVRLHYPIDRVDLPVISTLVSEFDVEPNLVQADVDARTGGWIVVQLHGSVEQLDRAMAWVNSQGVEISTVD